MLKTIASMIFGAILAGAIATAYAVTGTPPTPATGPGLVDGTWLNGLAGGLNNLTAYGLTSTGNVSTFATQLTPGYAIYQIDTAPTSNGGVNLPVCAAGSNIGIINNSSNVLLVFPSTLINALTATQDTIDGSKLSGAINVPVTSAAEFYCAKNGAWFH